jgi:hypothetical protein
MTSGQFKNIRMVGLPLSFAANEAIARLLLKREGIEDDSKDKEQRRDGTI